MKRFYAYALAMILLAVCVIFAFPAQTAADGELPVISWFTSGMTVSEAKEISPALKSFERDGQILADGELIASGDTVITDYAMYVAWVLGDVSGDGEVSPFSYILIKRHYMQTYMLDGQESFSADINIDGVIDQFDYILAKRIYFGTYAIEKPTNSDGVPVLLYHHILPDEVKATEKWMGNNITISTGEFRRQLQMLADGGYNVATVEEVVAYVRGEILLPDKSLVLCFDDGYRSNTYYAAPILKEFGFQATVFAIISGYEKQYVEEFDHDSLQKITPTDLAPWDGVIDQQCHTYNNHNHLDEQSYSDIYADLMRAQAVDKNAYFAYPYGDYDEEVIRAVRDAGFDAAFSTVERNARPGDNIFEIPRYTVLSPWTDAQYQNLISKAD